MTAKKLWSPSTTKNNLNLFLEYLADIGNFNSYSDLHKWSIEHKEIFWDKFWSFTDIEGDKKDDIFIDSKHFVDTKFFNSSTLNYAENLFDEVKEDQRKISMATIYNTLKQFTSLGMIREIVVDQNKSLYCNNNQSHYHLYIEDEGKVIDIPTQNIDLDIPSIPACLKLHDIDVIVRIRTLKDKNN